jgi:colanic acid/amylovoran biosynthesis glycosyltransferase
LTAIVAAAQTMLGRAYPLRRAVGPRLRVALPEASPRASFTRSSTADGAEAALLPADEGVANVATPMVPRTDPSLLSREAKAPTETSRSESAELRVAHVVQRFLPISETFIYTALCAQADAVQAVFTRHRENELQFEFPDVRLIPRHRLGRAVRWVPGAALRIDPLFRAARRFRPDVIHAHFSWNAALAMPVARGLSVPLVASFYGADVYVRRGSALRQTYAELFATGSIFRCLGPAAASELQRLGCPSDRLRIVPLGVDLSAFTFAPAPREDSLVILQVSRLVPKKGVDTTLAAFARALPELGPAELWLIGDGPERPALEELARQLGISAPVRFLGSLPPTEVCSRMARAHIGVQPSRRAPNGDGEGTPTVLLEMQARGVDVAATRHTDIPTIVAFPDRLVPEGDSEALADELVRLAHLSERERNERLAAGRNLVERQHDARRIADQLRGIYAEAAAG